MKKIIIPLVLLMWSLAIFAQNQVASATNATAGKLTVQFATAAITTDSYFAVYITNSSNQLVNTLAYRYSGNAQFATDFAPQLTTFYSLIGSSFNPASITNLKFVGNPDGVSGATISAAFPLTTVYWGQSANMATAVAALPDADYKVNFEMVKRNNNRSSGSVTFTKGPANSAPVVPAITSFTNMTVSWTPANTAINDVEFEKLYSLYPNPAVSSIYVSGLGIEGVDICSLSAKILIHSNESNVNISQLPKGAYLAVIYTKTGDMVVKKFQKM